MLCHNPSESNRQEVHRDKVLSELPAELASLQTCAGEQHNKRACRLVACADSAVVARLATYLSQLFV